MLAWAVADPGDAILLNRPIYGRFELDFTNREQVKILYADTDAETCLQVSAIEKYEEALAEAAASGISVRAILIVNPNNPLGTFASTAMTASPITHIFQANATTATLWWSS